MEAQERVWGGCRAYAGVRALDVSSAARWRGEVECEYRIARERAHRWPKVQECDLMRRM